MQQVHRVRFNTSIPHPGSVWHSAVHRRAGNAFSATLKMTKSSRDNDVPSIIHVEDVRCATLLSELVYRAAESADEAAFREAQVLVQEAVGASLNDVRCHKSGGQRFLVGETADAIYVAFQGTKSAIDWLANLNFFHGHFGWQHHHQQQHPSDSSSASSVSSRSSFASSSSSASSSRSRSSRAHIGFLKRANSAAVSISELHAVAAAAGKRLVLTGHSLGGAVAVLTTVRLLRSLTAEQANSSHTGSSPTGLGRLSGQEHEPHVRCISFATPAMANSDLLQEVTAAGWDQYITNIVMPEDPVVPFVNLLLKAPASPSHPPAISPTFFAGLDGRRPSSSISSSSSSSSASVSAGICDLSRSNSWGSSLTFDPSTLAEDLTATLAAAGSGPSAASTAAAAVVLQPLQNSLAAAAAADSWLVSAHTPSAAAAADLAEARAALGRSLSFASAGAIGVDGVGVGSLLLEGPSALEASTSSIELASWLAAAREAVKHQAGSQPSQRSFRDSSTANSNSGNSLCSLTSDALAAWTNVGVNTSSSSSSSTDEDSITSSSTGQTAGVYSPSALSPDSGSTMDRGSEYSFRLPVVASWALQVDTSIAGSLDSSSSSPRSPLSSPITQQQQQQLGLDAFAQASGTQPRAAAGPELAQDSSSSVQQKPNLSSQVVKQLRQLGSSRVGRVAWISGALAAGARCASAFAAPAALTGSGLSLFAILPRAFAGPAALAVLHLLGHAAYEAALPPSHPLGQQWVMTETRLEPVAKPLTSYPRTGEGLGLQELGGLFPGHRMIAYRRRLANLVSQSTTNTAAAAAAAAQDTARG